MAYRREVTVVYIDSNRLIRLRDESALLVYLHPQRTGGTRLKKALFAIFERNRVYAERVVGAARFADWRAVTAVDLQGFAAYAGHSDYVSRDLPRLTVYIGTIRHPFYRMLSYHEYCKNKENHPFRQLALQNEFVDFVRKGARVSPKYFRNLQCRRFCGRPKAKAATKTILNDYAAMVPMERLSDFVPLLAGFTAGARRAQVETIATDLDRYGPALSDDERVIEVLKWNSEDMALYDWVRRS